MTTYYTDPINGKDTNSGLIGSPFKTPRKGISLIQEGDTLILKDGIYGIDAIDKNYGLSIVSKKGTDTAWITIKSENRYGAKIASQFPDSIYRAGIIFSDSDYVRIEGFDIYGWDNTTSAGLPNSNIYFKYNKIHDNGYRAIPCTEGHRNMGKGGTGDGNNDVGNVWDSNIFYHLGRLESGCLDDAPHARDHGIYLRGSNVKIINNVFHEHKAGWAVQLDGGSSNPNGLEDVLIANNTFYGANPVSSGQIIAWFDTKNIKVYNNIFYAPKSHAIHVWEDAQYGYGFTYGPYDFQNNMVYNATMISETAMIEPGQLTMANNLTADPKFVNISTEIQLRDFHLQSTSPAIEKGFQLPEVAYDFDGNPRTGRNDIGAFQYIGNTSCSDLLTEFKITKI